VLKNQKWQAFKKIVVKINQDEVFVSDVDVDEEFFANTILTYLKEGGGGLGTNLTKQTVILL